MRPGHLEMLRFPAGSHGPGGGALVRSVQDTGDARAAGAYESVCEAGGGGVEGFSHHEWR